MHTTKLKKVFALLAVIAVIIALQTFAQTNQQQQPEKPKNLKVLPKNISHDDLIATMKGFSKALGVRCDKCHVTLSTGTPEHPDFDFAADDKKDKLIAREMYVMMMSINHKDLGKMDEKLEDIHCVTCHRGSLNPMVSVDSLPHQNKN